MANVQHNSLKNEDSHPVGYILPVADLPAPDAVDPGVGAFDPATRLFYVSNGVDRWQSYLPLPIGVVHGDLLFFNGTTFVRLPAGADGQVLRTHGSGQDPNWVTPAAVITDHGALNGLGDDDHSQYLTTGRGDARYAKPIDIVTDHGTLQGLGDDDHPHYLNVGRGDLRYYTQTALQTNGQAQVHWGNLLAVPAAFTSIPHSITGDRHTGIVTVLGRPGSDAAVPTEKAVRDALVTALYNSGNTGAAATIDWNNGLWQKVTLTAATPSLAFSNADTGKRLILLLVQDGTGNRNPSWPVGTKWEGGTEPTWSTGANAVDIVAFISDGTNFYGQLYGLGFA